MKRKKLNKKIKMREKGITLIALVITIIVLLILAGVSISMLVGENGILGMAGKASEKTKIATDDEQRRLAMYEAAMNLENMEYTDTKGEKATIPAGFAPTRIEGESLISEGLVITDSEGNEFVWIPVDNPTNYNGAGQLSKSTSEENWGSDGKTNEIGWKNDPDPENPSAMENIKESVKNNKGFYVARYEAGVPTNADFYVDKNSENKTYAGNDIEKTTETLKIKRNITKTTTGKSEISLKPVSKKGNQVWNFINQENAITLSKNMYEDNSSVNSYLIDFNAWNYICKYIFETKVKNLNNSSEYGNYKDNTTTNYEGIKGLFAKHVKNGSWTFPINYEYGNIPSDYPPRGKENNKNLLELATGICNDFKLYNIYDMAGNMWEWTAASNSTASDYKHAAIRGGSFCENGSECGIVYSEGRIDASGCDQHIGFRCVLYLK